MKSSFFQKTVAALQLVGLAISAAIVLAGCGGGGGGGEGGSSPGGTLFPVIQYTSQPIALYSPATIRPTWSGLYGETPNCVLSNGTLPTGLNLNSDCSISGTPTQFGSFNFTVTITVLNRTGSVSFARAVSVIAPGLRYLIHGFGSPAVKSNDYVNDLPNFYNAVLPTNSTNSWTYSLESGSLPPGLTLNTSTGAITGAAPLSGSYRAIIRAVLPTSFGPYTTSADYNIDINLVPLSYVNTGGTGSLLGVHTIYVSQPFSAAPIAYKAGSLGSFSVVLGPLPGNLVLNAGSGIISGTMPVSGYFIDGFPPVGISISAILTDSGINETILSDFNYSLRSPLQISYPSNIFVRTGTPLSISPTVTQASPLPLVSPSHTYHQRAAGGPTGCNLPPGTTYDDATGTLSGTPTIIGTYSCAIDVAMTNNGFNWTQTINLMIGVQ